MSEEEIWKRERFERWKKKATLRLERSMIYSMLKHGYVTEIRPDILNIFKFKQDQRKQVELLLDKLAMETEQSEKFDIPRITNLLKELTDVKVTNPPILWLRLLKLRRDMIAWKEDLEREKWENWS